MGGLEGTGRAGAGRAGGLDCGYDPLKESEGERSRRWQAISNTPQAIRHPAHSWAWYCNSVWGSHHLIVSSPNMSALESNKLTGPDFYRVFAHATQLWTNHQLKIKKPICCFTKLPDDDLRWSILSDSVRDYIKISLACSPPSNFACEEIRFSDFIGYFFIDMPLIGPLRWRFFIGMTLCRARTASRSPSSSRLSHINVHPHYNSPRNCWLLINMTNEESFTDYNRRLYKSGMVSISEICLWLTRRSELPLQLSYSSSIISFIALKVERPTSAKLSPKRS